MAVTLGGIALPDDMVWIDEFGFDPVAQATQRTLGGVNLIEESPLVAGVPITLGADSQWITRATLLLLRALAATPAQTHALILRGDSYTIAFRRPAIEATPIVQCADPVAGDFYAIRINLITV